eukprot:15002566-Alexandrium_andersonii.AAC.1
MSKSSPDPSCRSPRTSCSQTQCTRGTKGCGQLPNVLKGGTSSARSELVARRRVENGPGGAEIG